MKNLLIFPLFFLLFVHTTLSVKVCKNEEDYYFHFNSECRENPADKMNVTTILRKLFGFHAEEHPVTTRDGYTILLVRSYKNITKKYPVILGHGTATNSMCFVATMKKSMVYQLGVEGYDMWLINFRGSKYSRKHEKFSVEDDYFWDFSFHEMGLNDMPAIVNYVNEKTKIKALYVGLSMGTSVMLVYSSLKSNEAKEKILGAVLLGTAGKFVNGNSTLKILDPKVSSLGKIFPEHKHGAILYDSTFSKSSLKFIAESPFLMKLFGKFILGILDGYNPDQLDWTTLPIVLTTSIDITTDKMMSHYGQCIETGDFKPFDFGVEENIRRYNSTKPPLYPVENITIPVAMVASNGDIITPIAGNIELYNQLQNKCGFFVPTDNMLTHTGLISAKTIRREVNLPTIKFLKDMENNDCKST